MSNLKDTMSDLGSFISKLLVIIGIVMIVVGGYNLSADNMAGVPFINKVQFFSLMNPWLFTAMGIGVYFLAYIFDGDAAEEVTEDVADGVTNIIGGTLSTVASVLMPLVPYALMFLAGKWAWDKYNDNQDQKAIEESLDRSQRQFEQELSQARQLREASQYLAPTATPYANSTNQVESQVIAGGGSIPAY